MSPIALGSYAMHISVIDFKLFSKQFFVRYLQDNYYRVSDYPLDESQVKAWEDCYDVLRNAFFSLPDSYNMLDLVFEYVLPQHNPSSNRFVNENHIRADIILVSAKSALVLEFKQRSDDFIGLFHQAKKYKNRLQDYHIASEDLEVESLLVLTKAKNYWDDCDGVTGCSPDWLCDVIPDLLGDEPEKHPNILQWLDSAFLNYEMPVKEEPPYLPILLHVADQLEAIDNRLKRLEEKKAQIKKTINKD